MTNCVAFCAKSGKSLFMETKNLYHAHDENSVHRAPGPGTVRPAS